MQTIYTKLVIDIATDEVIERESFEYEGPLAEAVTYNKFDSFVEALAEKVHNLGSDVLQVALSPAANTPAAANTNLAALTQIAYTNLSTQVVAISTSAQSAGLYKLVLTDLVLTASGAVAAFQFVTLFNQSAAADELICWWSYGSAVTLANLETFTIDFDAGTGVLQLQ